MTKEAYLKALGDGLSAVNKQEKDSIVDYYRGYIEDAGDEGEAIAQLGQPEALANKLLSQMPDAPKAQRSQAAKIWMGALYFLASPLLLALATVAIALYLTLWTVVLCLALAVVLLGACPALVAVLLLGCGAAYILVAVFVGPAQWATQLLFGGIGLSALCGGLMLIRPAMTILRSSCRYVVAMARWCVDTSAKLFQRRKV